MSTENFEKKSTTTGHLKRLSKVGPQTKVLSDDLVELVPPWLKQLLAKYGEREGRLVGLGEGPESIEERRVDLADADTDLSALFDQMAEGGVSQPPPDRISTSVEWGGYDQGRSEPPPAPIDDLLDNLSVDLNYQDSASPYPSGSSAGTEAPDWLTGVRPEASGAAAPDWLAEMISPGEVIPPASPSPPQPVDVPDWLNEALETPTTSAPKEPISPLPSVPPKPTEKTPDVPDWLEEALGSPTTTPAAPPTAVLPPIPTPPSNFDVPDWLAEPPAASADISAPATKMLPPMEPAESAQVPDWLTDMVSPPTFIESSIGLGIPEGDEDVAVPDWLAEIAPPVADRPEITPPSVTAPLPDTTSQPPAEPPVATASKYGTSWLGQEQPGLPALDWLFQSDTPAATPAVEPETATPGQTDWLFDSDMDTTSLPTSAVSSPPQPEAEALSWLDDIQFESPAGTVEETFPDWLKDLEPPAAAPDEATDWLQRLQSDSAEATELDSTSGLQGSFELDWLADLNIRPDATPPIPAPTSAALMADDNTPPWFTQVDETPPLPSESAQEAPKNAETKSKYKRLKPLPPEPTPMLAVPDWIAGLTSTEAEASQIPTAAPDWTEQPIPPGSSNLPTESLSETTAGPALPGLMSVPQPEAPSSPEPAQAEPPAWTPEPLISAGSEAATEPDDWLRNLSAQVAPSPDWLAELSASAPEASLEDWQTVETPAEGADLLAARLDWLTGTGAEPATPPSVMPTSTTPELPNWFEEDTPPAPLETTPAPAVKSVEAKDQAELDWLADIPIPTIAEEPPATPAEGEKTSAEIEPETLPWLTLPADLSDFTPLPLDFEVTEAFEPPSWLTDLSLLGEQESAAAEQGETEIELEAPPWVGQVPSALPDTSSPMVNLSPPPVVWDIMPGDELDTDLETPAWLEETAEAEPTPSWLTELSADTIAKLPETPSESTEAETEESPAWLTQLSELPASPTPAPPIETELATPPWLEELSSTAAPPTQTETMETAAWGVDFAPAAPVETGEELTEPPSEAGVIAEPEEIPAWLAELSSLDASEIPTSTGEAELGFETPPWLAELPAESIPDLDSQETRTRLSGLPADTSPVGEETPAWLSDVSAESSVTAEIESESAMPDWLTELPEIAAPDSAEPGREVELELETPPWLAQLSPEVETAMETPSWLTEVPAATPSQLEETPSWLTELVRETPATAEFPGLPAESLEGPAVQPPMEVETPQPLAEEDETPPWLTTLRDETRADSTLAAPVSESAMEFEIPSWLTELPTEAESEETPAWLAELPQVPEVATPAPELTTETPAWITEFTAETRVEPETPAWLTELTAPAQLPALAEETPAWLTEASTPTIEPETEFETPPWLAQPSTQAPSELEETPAWLSELDAVMPTASEETPAWLAELGDAAPAEPLVSVVEPEAPSWLTELPGGAKAEQELETPFWLKELPVAPEAAVEPETPVWLTELPGETKAVVEPEQELETPAWLKELPVAPEAVAEPETPAWLAELTATSSLQPIETTQDEAAEVEAVFPDWLAELQKGSSAETQAEATETAPVEAVEEIPDWLTELSFSPAEAELATISTEPEVETELPSWLASLELPSATAAQPEEMVDQEAQIPAWFTELPEEPVVETAPVAPGSDVELELETPAWLSELSVQAKAETEVPVELEETQAELPPWTEALEVKTAAPLGKLSLEAETPSGLTGLPAEVEVEAEEAPSWLTELRGKAVDELESSMGETEVKEAPPAWGAELGTRVLVGPELEDVATWLTELTKATPTEPSASTAEAVTKLEAPAWLTDLPSETPATLESEVEEAPAWLTELADTTPTDATTTQAVTEAGDETPAWLVGLAGTVLTASAEAVPAEEEDVDDWLTELRATSGADKPAEVEEPVGTETTAVLQETAPEVAEPEAVTKMELPSWLADLDEMSTKVGLAHEAEIPAWLANLPEAEEPVSAVSPDDEIPPWLADLSTDELKRPSWLTGTIEAVDLELASPETPAEDTTWEVTNAPPAEPVDVAAEPIAPAASPPIEAEDDIPAWLADLSTDELKRPSWLTGTTAAEGIEFTPVEALSEASPIEPDLAPPAESSQVAPSAAAPLSATGIEKEILPWLADLSSDELKGPSWLSDIPEAPSIEPPTIELAGEPESFGAETTQPAESIAVVDETIMAAAPVMPLEIEPATTAEPPQVSSVEAEAELPGWLMDEPKTIEAEVPAPEPEAFDTTLPDIEPDAPDWLKEEVHTSSLAVGVGRPQAWVGQSPAAAESSEAPATPVERMSDWLRGLKPAEEALEAEENKASEATGMLAAMAPLLPVEKITPLPPVLDPQATATTAQSDAVLEAARNFYAIASQAPQPATLPEPLTRGEQLTGRIARAVLYLLFLGLLALPLIPSLQKVVDPATGRRVPWTEPAGSLAEVLDKQRRELVSAQLGAIDLQQPSSIALVSFDYSAATQGEMQPLAEAVIGRLRGQGMRLVLVSLEPEGPGLAQRTLEKILAERNETYAVDTVNLGYLPGQVLGIRALVAGRTQFASLADFKDGLTFQAEERSNWSGVNNLGQVNIVVTLTDNPTTARWWIEQMTTAIPAASGERYLLAATSAMADPVLRPYVDTQQLHGLISGINGAAAIEAGRQNFGPARQMLDSQGIAHLLMVILIAFGTMAGWMPTTEKKG